MTSTLRSTFSFTVVVLSKEGITKETFTQPPTSVVVFPELIQRLVLELKPDEIYIKVNSSKSYMYKSLVPQSGKFLLMDVSLNEGGTIG